jgi:hypothetical protein
MQAMWSRRPPRPRLSEEERCQALRADGGPCEARRWGGTPWCWAHQPGRFHRLAGGVEESDPLDAAVETWLTLWRLTHDEDQEECPLR